MEALRALLLLVLGTSSALALNNGLALTPPMGWLSWQRFRCNINCKNYSDSCINEQLYMQMADRMVADGYRDAGYVYVNIDDCWAALERDPDTFQLVADPDRFPHGIKWLADYMHQRGLKLGIYGDFGTLTCGGYPGSKFYMDIDAQTFADWGVDSLKLDGCYSTIKDYTVGYPTMEKFLNKTNRPILYSCSWPAYVVFSGIIPDYQKIADACNIWRNYGDIDDNWDSVKDIIDFYGNNTGNFSGYAKPGSFNDPDMLIIGDFGLSYDQERVQMALWAILAAPLLMSNDLRKIRPESKALLLNRNVIAINQDRLGLQGNRVMKTNQMEVWTKPVTPKGSYAVAIRNLQEGGSEVALSVVLGSIGLNSPSGYNLTEVFDGTPVGVMKNTDTLTAMVNPSGIALFKAKAL